MTVCNKSVVSFDGGGGLLGGGAAVEMHSSWMGDPGLDDAREGGLDGGLDGGLEGGLEGGREGGLGGTLGDEGRLGGKGLEGAVAAAFEGVGGLWGKLGDTGRLGDGGCSRITTLLVPKKLFCVWSLL